IGAGLMLKSLWHLQQVNPGFNPGNVLTMQVALPATSYSQNYQVTNGYQQLLEGIATVPGVKCVAAVWRKPLVDSGVPNNITIEGYTPLPGGPEQNSDTQIVSAGYFQTL